MNSLLANIKKRASSIMLQNISNSIGIKDKVLSFNIFGNYLCTTLIEKLFGVLKGIIQLHIGKSMIILENMKLPEDFTNVINLMKRKKLEILNLCIIEIIYSK